jgi:RNA polymerase sigma factor (TIGR02999 family)
MSDVTLLLQRWSTGDRAALDRLLPLVYEELRSQASRQLAHERRDHTLQVTALVNEAYLRLAGQDRGAWAGRSQFLIVAATIMRRVLVDHARRQAAEKRPPAEQRLCIDEIDLPVDDGIDLLALDSAMERLAEIDPRQGRIIELRYFAGLNIEQVAATLDLSVSTVTRDWRMARAWLQRELDN